MPTYRNDSSETRHVYDINDVFTKVAPTESIQTYEFLGTGWAETSELPIYNPVAFATEITLTADGIGNSYITFDHTKIKTLRIQEISNTITSVHAQNASTTPALFENLTSSTSYIPEIKNEGNFRKLVFKGSGTCKVVGFYN